MLGLKVAYSSQGFLLSFVLARTLGAAGYGIYTYALSWAVFLGLLSIVGLDKLVTREVAIDRGRENWGRVRGLVRTANRTGFAVSVAVVVVVATITSIVNNVGLTEMSFTVLVGLLMVPILTLMKVRQAALAGLGEVALGQWPELLLHPATVTALVAIWWLATGQVLAHVAMFFTVLSSAAMLVVGACLLHRTMRQAAQSEPLPPLRLPWRETLWPLTLMSGVQGIQAQADMLLLGLLAPAAAVGAYGVASRGGQLVTFFLLAAVPALGPATASLYASGDRPELERLAVTTARTTTLLTLPVALGLILFGRWALALFGPGFPAGAPALAILACGQFVNVACGPVGTVLIMTGHERIVLRRVGVAAVANAALSAVLIPFLGALGAAMGSATGTILWNVLLAWDVRQRLGIHATAFARIRRSAPLNHAANRG